MYVWDVAFTTQRPMRSLPRLMTLARERRQDTDYSFFGKFRPASDYCLFQYTLSGEGIFVDGSGEHRVKPGQGFLCIVNDPATAYRYPEDANEPWEFLYIDFGGEAAFNLVKELVQRNGPIYELPLDNPQIRRLESLKGHLSDQVERRSVQAGEGAAIVMALLCELESSFSSKPDEMRLAAQELVRKIDLMMEGSLPEGMPIQEIAAKLKISREHLSRIYQRETGLPPHKRMLWLRMEWAGRFLKEECLSVKEIALNSGFSGQQHFARLFKKVMKATPSQFRRNGGF